MEYQDIIRESVVLPLLSQGVTRQTKAFCPMCRDDRQKHRNDKSLSVHFKDDVALFRCHHCGVEGAIKLDSAPSITQEPRNEVVRDEFTEISIDNIEWLVDKRGISEETLADCGVIGSRRWMNGDGRGREADVIGFPYITGSTYGDSKVEAVKWRTPDKSFSQSGAARTLWRQENFSGGDLIICEGEIDAMSFQEAGIFACSVPNGAPSSKSQNYGQKFQYLWNAREKISKADRIILATDADDPGNFLAEEIARRLGKAKCWRVRFPEDCKDPNDVLLKHGKQGLVHALESATPWPISGLRSATDFIEAVSELHENGFAKTIGLDIYDLDQIYKVGTQTLTIVTGIPGSGKSTFLTWAMSKLASHNDWRFCIFSAEVPTEIHISQLCSAFTGKPFTGPDKMSKEELDRAIRWVDQHFIFIDDDDTSIETVLDRVYASVLRLGVTGVVIDPYNFLSASKSSDDNSSHSINQMLVKLKRFATEHELAIWLVAHPAKLFREGGKMPTPGGYSISGSAAFFNLADTGLTVSRGDNKGVSVVTCWKSRFPWLGDTGSALLSFNRETNTFGEMSVGKEKKTSWQNYDFDDF